MGYFNSSLMTRGIPPLSFHALLCFSSAFKGFGQSHKQRPPEKPFSVLVDAPILRG
jgi:hypothetical protein